MNLTTKARNQISKTSLMKSIIVITLLVLIVISRASSSSLDKFYETCAGSFTCGTMSGIQYPFSRNEDPTYCGYPGFKLDCNGRNAPSIDINNMTYHVRSIDQPTQMLKIIREDVMGSICPHDFINTTTNHNLFDYSSTYMNISFLYGCPDSFNLHGKPSSCDGKGIKSYVFVLRTKTLGMQQECDRPGSNYGSPLDW